MADLKISQLSDGGASQAADEYVVARSGSNFRIDGASVAAAATSVGTLTSLTVSGNLTVDTNTLLVDSSGNFVGIGTTPDSKLHVVSGSGSTLAQLRIGFNNTSVNYYDANTHYFRDGSGPTDRMILNSSGNLGLGVTPSAKLHVKGSGELLRLESTDLTGNCFIRFQDSGDRKGYMGFAAGANNDFFIVNEESASAMIFQTAAVERARITSGGYFKASDDGTYDNSTGSSHEFSNTANSVTTLIRSTNASFSQYGMRNSATRSSTSAYEFATFYSGGFADIEFTFRGDGNGYADGTFNNNGADYAEYFESATGTALTVGATVVLDGNKVREATEDDAPSAILGVVRPKAPGKASMVIGNTAWNKWSNKYLTDDFDCYVMEAHEVVEWTDEDGKAHSYESHRIPDDVVVPEDAVRKTHDEKGNAFEHYKLNPAYDPSVEYVPREKRDEWVIVGLVGQVKVLKGQPVNDRWVKMRDVSAAVEEWMIR